MNFYSVNELETGTTKIYENVRSNGEAVITNEGKPMLLMLDISNVDYEAIIRAVRQAKVTAVFESMRNIAAENGYMTDEEIEAEIAAARQERRNREGRN